MSCLLNINLQIPNKHFLEKSAFEHGLSFLQDTGLFPKPNFFLNFAKPGLRHLPGDHGPGPTTFLSPPPNKGATPRGIGGQYT